MIITDRPVDVAALRQEWIKVVNRWSFDGGLDYKTQRVSCRCCFACIIDDLRRYPSPFRISLLTELFEDVGFAAELDFQIEFATTDTAAGWLTRRLGVD